VLVGEIGVWWCDGLELDESPELLNVVEVDANVAPKEEMSALDDGGAYTDGAGERCAEHGAVVYLDDPVSALALLRFARALELDEVGATGTLFSELQPTVRDLEIVIALPDLAVVYRAESSTHLQGTNGALIGCLKLDVPSRCLHLADCDVRRGAECERVVRSRRSESVGTIGETEREGNMATVGVRYVVDDVDAAIDFYCRHLGFHEDMHPAPTFAMLSRDDLRLVLSAPSGTGGGGQAMPDGTMPEPGGWNRFQLEVADIEAKVKELRRDDVSFRNELVTGVGGKQILVEDPSGNLVELFEPTRREASLSG
jgi:catechol 2,3-dioxygenase-like lactoylglutathione lyase family enzyme